ncbi:hypothetical protein E2C01_011510 [Portunus trituberculatus]|uniref:Uncharacterized protein n=1 Tax=Portunus trituberculatus TaxID=210409 RepID=A0A5B7DBG3_PORTR|nr:hypothetical protein [Portunus trituberculatus]
MSCRRGSRHAIGWERAANGIIETTARGAQWGVARRSSSEPRKPVESGAAAPAPRHLRQGHQIGILTSKRVWVIEVVGRESTEMGPEGSLLFGRPSLCAL